MRHFLERVFLHFGKRFRPSDGCWHILLDESYNFCLKLFSIEIFVFEEISKNKTHFGTAISHTRSGDGWWVQAVRLCIGTRRSRWSLSDVDPTSHLGDRGVNVKFSKKSGFLGWVWGFSKSVGYHYRGLDRGCDFCLKLFPIAIFVFERGPF